MAEHLIAWIGKNDLDAAKDGDVTGGPISGTVAARRFQSVWLLDNWRTAESRAFTDWLAISGKIKVNRRDCRLRSESDLAEIYHAAIGVIEQMEAAGISDEQITCHLSPGTSTMKACWLLIAPRYNLRIIRSDKVNGPQYVPLPFDIAAEYRADKKIQRLSAGEALPSSKFGKLQFRSGVMRAAVQLARKAATMPWPVLVEGPSGSGKEFLADAVFEASARSDRPFIKVNCGALPQDLIESELFGTVKGAFTGADKGRAGKFEAANTGTIFLDEVGEMSPAAQVRLLRVLEENKVTRVGENLPREIDVRVIAATNRNLLTEVAKGRFREDLMYRLMVVRIEIPPLCQRKDDLLLLLDVILGEVNAAMAERRMPQKHLTLAARDQLRRHNWPGNVRELRNTLLRCAVSRLEEEEIDEQIVVANLLRHAQDHKSILDRPFVKGFELRDVVGELCCRYIDRALNETKGNRTKAAQMLGFNNRQTLDNWLARYGDDRREE